MRAFLSRLRERIRQRLMSERPFYYRSDVLDRAVDLEMRAIADEVFERSEFAKRKGIDGSS